MHTSACRNSINIMILLLNGCRGLINHPADVVHHGPPASDLAHLITIIFKTFLRQDLGELGIAVRKFATQNIEVMQYKDPYKVLEDHLILLLPLAIFHFLRTFIKKLIT